MEKKTQIMEFEDRNGKICSIQKSSLANEDCIWIGIDDVEVKILGSKIQEGITGWVNLPLPEDAMVNGRMHLTRKQVLELLPILEKFAKTGQI